MVNYLSVIQMDCTAVITPVIVEIRHQTALVTIALITKARLLEFIHDLNKRFGTQGMHGCSGCTNPQIFGTSPFAPANFEDFSIMCTP